MITVTKSAKKKIQDLIKEGGLDDTYFLRVSVTGGGCSGLKNNLDFDNIIKDDDNKFEDKGIKIVCENKSLLFLFGTELDYSDGLNGKGFVWNNPNSVRNCGCGSSFSV